MKEILGRRVGDAVRWTSAGGVSRLVLEYLGSFAGSYDVTAHSDPYRCVVNLERIMSAPNNERTLIVDEAARDGILVERHRWDLVARRRSSSSVSGTGEPLNIFSRGLFPRVMVTARVPLCFQLSRFFAIVGLLCP